MVDSNDTTPPYQRQRIVGRIKTTLAILFGATFLSMQLTAQTFTVLHTFTNAPDGRMPRAVFVAGGDTLYGTTSSGGMFTNGTVFKINTDGSGFAVLKSFPATSGSPATNSEGRAPIAGMALGGDTLYGTTANGGTGAVGVIFAINTNGTGFTVLKTFNRRVSSGGGSTNYDGAGPRGTLLLAGNALYGTAPNGGTNGFGTVFKINTDGNDFTVLKYFTGLDDGGLPEAGLTLVDDILYGTVAAGTSNTHGGVFSVKTNGTDFTVLRSFLTSDGTLPFADLVSDGTNLYGTTTSGGTSGNGTVFRINTNGTGFSVLKSFSAMVSTTNSDGADPIAGLAFNGRALYGTTQLGGISGTGTVYTINADGTGFAVLKHFAGSDGALPLANLLLKRSSLYGTASAGGGSADSGVLFSLTGVPQIQISDGSFGVQTNRFGFNITGIAEPPIVIEAATNISAANWLPLQTNLLGAGPLYFSDATWTNFAARFYRVRLQ